MNGILGAQSNMLPTALGIAQNVAGKDDSSGNKPSEIIARYLQKKGIPLDKGMAGVQQELQNGLKLARYEDTLMGFKPLGQGKAQIHFFTIDKPHVFDEAVRHFVQQLKQGNIQVIYDSLLDGPTAKALHDAGAHIQASDIPKFQLKATL
jgi:hypothetical protein